MRIAIVPNDRRLTDNKIFKDPGTFPETGYGPQFVRGLIKAKEVLNSEGYEIDTVDKVELGEVDICIFIDIDFQVLDDIRKMERPPKTVYLMREPPSVIPINSIANFTKYANMFDSVLTWNDELVANFEGYVKYNYPQQDTIQWNEDIKFSEKNLLVNVSARKNSNHPNELYTHREKIIKYFEENSKRDLTLHGFHWNRRPYATDIYSGIIFRGYHYDSWDGMFTTSELFPNKYEIYEGPIEDKNEAYQSHRFALSFENMTGIDGYITEKIFDCFRGGIVPVYWGANNVTDYIPADCFIDYRDYSSPEELHHRLKSMTEAEHGEYLREIETFCEGGWSCFTPETFATQFLEAVELAEKREIPAIGQAYAQDDAVLEIESRAKLERVRTGNFDHGTFKDFIYFGKYAIESPNVIAEKPSILIDMFKKLY